MLSSHQKQSLLISGSRMPVPPPGTSGLCWPWRDHNKTVHILSSWGMKREGKADPNHQMPLEGDVLPSCSLQHREGSWFASSRLGSTRPRFVSLLLSACMQHLEQPQQHTKQLPAAHQGTRSCVQSFRGIMQATPLRQSCSSPLPGCQLPPQDSLAAGDQPRGC